jgi:uncharacterized membrane protein YoaK (UPF0700 family)
VPSAKNSRYFTLLLILAFAGGLADAGSFVLVSSFTGHLTGNTVLAMVNLAAGVWARAGSCALAGAAFLAGTGIGSRWWPHEPHRTDVRRLVVPLAVETLLIATGVLGKASLGDLGTGAFVTCLCFALGLQNGTIQHFGTVGIHTTYVTGMTTTLVNFLFRPASPTTPDNEGVLSPKRVLAQIVGGFIAGAFVGGLLCSRFGLSGFALLLLTMAVAVVMSLVDGRGV